MTSYHDHCFKEIEPCGEPLVIGVGRHFNGPVEIVAFESGIGLCVEVDLFSFGTGGSCPAGIHPPEGQAISANGVSVLFGKNSFTQVEGALAPEVAAVRVRYRREGEVRRSWGIVAQVAGKLQERLGEDEPFGVFEATVRGCVPAKRLHLIALDATGAVLGEAPLRSSSRQCDRTVISGPPPNKNG